MATIVLESFIPDRCWIAPLMPTAICNSGATTFGLADLQFVGHHAGVHCGTRRADGPAQFVGELLEHGGFSPLPMPRPPLTTTLAAVRSGLSLSPLLSEIFSGSSGATAASMDAASTPAAPPSSSTFSKAVARTVATVTGCVVLTVANALPA